jgi:hypothetical protein
VGSPISYTYTTRFHHRTTPTNHSRSNTTAKSIVTTSFRSRPAANFRNHTTASTDPENGNTHRPSFTECTIKRTVTCTGSVLVPQTSNITNPSTITRTHTGAKDDTVKSSEHTQSCCKISDCKAKHEGDKRGSRKMRVASAVVFCY